MGHGVGRIGVGGAQLQGAFRQPKGLLRQSNLVVGEGVVAEEDPVVPVVRLQALQEVKELLGETSHPGPAAAQDVQTNAQLEHQRVPGVFGKVLSNEGEGLLALAAQKQPEGIDLLPFSA